jgi:hypothetical protein
MACAVPVRGRLIGPECLASILEDVPEPVRVPVPVPPRGEWLALAGFALALVVTIFPWSRFGGSRAFLGAWTLHWSLAAAIAALAGVAFALRARVRPVDPWVGIGIYGVLAAAVGLAAAVHYRSPPLLSESTKAPLVAVLGAAVALLGAARKALTLLRVRRLTG